MKGTLFLAGSGQDGLLPVLARRAWDSVGKKRARVAVTYAPVAGDASGLKFMSERMPRLFPGATLERFAVAGETGATSAQEARAVVERADLVFVSGGDPTLGAKVLAAAGASSWIRAALDRGAAVMGVSAGSIALGAWWADWPDDDEGDEDAQLARTSLCECIGAAGDLVFDAHAEEDDWDELRIVARLCAREGKRARFLGIPTGGSVVVHGDGTIETVGKPPFELR